LNVMGIYLWMVYLFFFFQAEDGIRDRNVTGVQTCALPIYFRFGRQRSAGFAFSLSYPSHIPAAEAEVGQFDLGYGNADKVFSLRSEERRVGKECRSRWSREH